MKICYNYYNKIVATKHIKKVGLTMNIGKKIKLLRKENDITHEKLAAYFKELGL